jgi:hypothetical protein
VTPLTLDRIAAGNYSVSLTLDGDQAWTTTVQVVAGARARVAASLAGGGREE